MATTLQNSAVAAQLLASKDSEPETPPVEADDTNNPGSPENDSQEEPDSGKLSQSIDWGNIQRTSSPLSELDQLDPEDSGTEIGNSTSLMKKTLQSQRTRIKHRKWEGSHFVAKTSSSAAPVGGSTSTSNQGSNSKTDLPRATDHTTNTTSPANSPESLTTTLPSAAPRPFPLEPRQPSQTLDEPAPQTDSSDDSGSDSLPEVADMLARTRPSYGGSQASQSRSATIREDAICDVKMDLDDGLPRTPIKRQHTDSPRILKSPYKPTYNVIETPEKVVIEIIDSDLECGGPAPAKSKGLSGMSRFHAPYP
jgi:hypothetical protein